MSGPSVISRVVLPPGIDTDALKSILEKTTEIDLLIDKMSDKLKYRLRTSAEAFQRTVLDCCRDHDVSKPNIARVDGEVVVAVSSLDLGLSSPNPPITPRRGRRPAPPPPQNKESYVTCPTCQELILSDLIVTHAAQLHQQVVEVVDVSWNETAPGNLAVANLEIVTDGKFKCQICEAKVAMANEAGQDVEVEEFAYTTREILIKHVDQMHTKVSLKLINADGSVAVKGSNLITISTGELVPQSKKWLYCELSCPRCRVRKRVGHSLQKSYYWLVNHLHERHNSALPDDAMMHYCDKCHYKSHNYKLWRDHYRYNHTQNSHKRKEQCPECQKELLVRFMPKHRAAKHGVFTNSQLDFLRSIPCPVCEKVFKTQAHQDSHFRRVHLSLRDAMCDQCDARFYEQSQLELHMFSKHNTNINNKNLLPCQVEGCDFVTIRADIMSKHTITHQTHGTYPCKKCPKTFKTINNLKQHILVKHETETKFQCQTCEFKTHARQYLLRHERMHVATKPYKCDFGRCSYASHYRENLVKHKQRVHRIEPPKSKRRKVQQTFDTTANIEHSDCIQSNALETQMDQSNIDLRVVDMSHSDHGVYASSLDLISSVTASQAKIDTSNVQQQFY